MSSTAVDSTLPLPPIRATVGGSAGSTTDVPTSFPLMAAVSEDPISLWLKLGALEKLEQAVLDGYGDHLFGKTSRIPQVNKFLRQVPAFQTKINEIHQAVVEGRLRQVQQLIDHKKLAFCRDHVGASPLHKAVLYNHKEIVLYLLERYGSVVHSGDHQGRTPLHYAAVLSDEGEIHQILLDGGADDRATDVYGHKPDYYLNTPNELTVDQLKEGAVVNKIKRVRPKAKSTRMGEHRGLSAKPGINVTQIRDLMSSDSNLPALEELVMQGHGNKLLGETSQEAEVQEFLERVPKLLEQIAEVHRASVRGRVNEVQELIKDYPNLVAARDQLGATPLHKSVLYGHLEASQEFAQQCPSALNAKDVDGRTPLHYAAALKDKDIYYALLNGGSSNLIVDSKSKTPEHYLQNPGQLNLDQIMKRSQRVNAMHAANTTTRMKIRSPITKSTSEGDSLKSLANGESSNVSVNGDETQSVDQSPVIQAVRQPRRPRFRTRPPLPPPRLQRLEVNSANLRKWVQEEDLEKLEGAVIQGFAEKVSQQETEAEGVRLYLDEEVPQLVERIKAIHSAISNDDLALLQKQLDKEDYALAKDHMGMTPVHRAVILGRQAALTFLIGKFPETVNARDKDGRTALHYAAAKTRKDGLNTYKSLLEAGADPNMRDNRGKSPEYYRTHHLPVPSSMSNKLKTALGRRSHSEPPLKRKPITAPPAIQEKVTVALKNGDVDVLQELVLEGYGQLLLGRQSWYDNVKQFLRTVNPQMTSIKGIHEACATGDLETLKTLIEADDKLLKAKNETGQCAIHIAVSNQQPEIIKYLLENYPASITLKDGGGKTPLHTAGVANLPDMYKLLVDSKADVRVLDQRGKTADYYLSMFEMRGPYGSKYSGKKKHSAKKEDDEEPKSEPEANQEAEESKGEPETNQAEESKIEPETSQEAEEVIEKQAVESAENTEVEIEQKLEELEANTKEAETPETKDEGVGEEADPPKSEEISTDPPEEKTETEAETSEEPLLESEASEGADSGIGSDDKEATQTETKANDAETTENEPETEATVIKATDTEANESEKEISEPETEANGTEAAETEVTEKEQEVAASETKETVVVETEITKTVVEKDATEVEESNQVSDSQTTEAESIKTTEEESTETAEVGEAKIETTTVAETERDSEQKVEEDTNAEESTTKTNEDIVSEDKPPDTEATSSEVVEENTEKEANETEEIAANNENNEDGQAQVGGVVVSEEQEISKDGATEDSPAVNEGGSEEAGTDTADAQVEAGIEESKEVTEAVTETEIVEQAGESSSEQTEGEVTEQKDESTSAVETNENKPETESGEVEAEKTTGEQEAMENSESTKDAENPAETDETTAAIESDPPAEAEQVESQQAEAETEQETSVNAAQEIVTESNPETGDSQQEANPEPGDSEQETNTDPGKSEQEANLEPGDSEQVQDNAEDAQVEESAVTVLEDEIDGQESANKTPEPTNEENVDNSEDKKGQEESDRLSELIDKWILEKDLLRLEHVVIAGQGERLLGKTSDDKQVVEFLNLVPSYMERIRTVHEAVVRGNIAEVRTVLTRKRFALSRDHMGASPLHLAVLHGHKDILIYIMNQFPETLDGPDNEGMTPLHYAAVVPDYGHSFLVLEKAGANKDIVDKMGNTPQYYFDKPEIFEKLLQNYKLTNQFSGEEPSESESVDLWQRPPTAEIMKRLTPPSDGSVTPTSQDESAQEDVKDVEELIMPAIEDSFPDDFGYTERLGNALVEGLVKLSKYRPDDPIGYLATWLFQYASHLNKLDFESGRNTTNSNGGRLGTPYPEEMKRSSLLEPLMNGDDRPIGGARSVMGNTSRLMSSLMDENFPEEECDVPLDFEDHTKMKDEEGRTVLHFAAIREIDPNSFYSSIAQTEMLLGERDANFKTARDLAEDNGLDANVAAIDRYMLDAMMEQRISFLQMMFHQGYDYVSRLPSMQDLEGEVLTNYLNSQELYSVVTVIQDGAEFQTTRDELHTLIRHGCLDMVESLISKDNSLVTAKNLRGRCSLHIAVLFDNMEIIESLVKHNASAVHVPDNLGRTALHYAMAVDKVEEIGKILIKAGSLRSSKDVKMRTPSYNFIYKNDVQAIQLEEISLA